MYSLIFLKAKNEEKLKKIVLLLRSKSVLPILRKYKFILKDLILIFLFEDCPLMYKKGICKFSKKY